MKNLFARFLIVLLGLAAFAHRASAAAIISVSSSPTPAYYRAGQTVPITVTFPQTVFVTGTPLLALNDGGTAHYVSGSGGAALLFNYTVSAGDTASPLDYASTSALTLNGGTINIATGAPASLGLTPPGRGGSLSANANVVIDTTAPAVMIGPASAQLVPSGGSVSYTVTYSDANFASASLTAADVILSNPGVTGQIGLTVNNATTYTVTLSGLVGPGGQSISIAAGTATDLAGNTAAAAGPSSGFTVTAPATHFSVAMPATATAGVSFNGTVTALDAQGNRVGSYSGTVHFTSSDPSAVLPADFTMQGGVGTLTFTLKTAGNQTVTATDTVSSSITGTSGNVTVSAAAATHFAVSLPSTATVGAPFGGTITALDAFNNVATSYTGTTHFTSTDPSAVLPANATLTLGTGTFNFTLKTAGSQTVTTTDTVNSTITGTSGNVSVSVGNSTRFAVVLPSTATAGTAVSGTVTALDSFGNTATGYAGTVHFTSSDGLAVLPADSMLTAGVGTFSFTLKTAGNQNVTAKDTASPSITGTSGNVAVSAAAVTHFAVVLPGSAAAGATVGGTVTALDTFGNTATSFSGAVRITSTDGAAVLPFDPALSKGVGTFGFTFETAGVQTVTATEIGTIITGTSSPVTVISASAAQFSVVVPASVIGGAPFSGTVIAFDSQDNVATAYTGTVHFTSSDGSATLPADAILTNGEGTFNFTLKTQGSQTITTTDTAIQSITGTSPAIAVIALPATLELYVSDNGNNTVSKISSTGVVSPVVTSGLSGPEGLAFGSSGDLYVANSTAGTISQVGPGNVVTTFATGFQNPQGLAFGGGHLYVANGGTGAILKVDSGGGVTTLVSAGLTTPIALVIDAASNIYVTDIGAGTLDRVAPSGGISDFVTGLSFPTGLTFGSGGDLYAAGNSGNSISQITLGGAVSPFITTGLRSPYGLVSDAQGNLYVANEASGTIAVITPAGSVLTLASGLIRPQFLAIAPPPSHNPPVLAPIPSYTIFDALLLTIFTSATERSFPPLALTYSLGPGAPAGASIDPNTGVFQWRPTVGQAPGTNTISVIVTDNGSPPLSATQQFTVGVMPVPDEFSISFGDTNMFVGQTNFVPISLTSQLALTNLSVVLQAPSNILTNVALSAVSPEVASALLQPLGGGVYNITFSLNPPVHPMGSRVLANLDFASAPMVHSAIVPLLATQPTALQFDGTAPAQATADKGQVIIVGLEPVLVASLNANLTRLLTMYANPGSNYQLGFTASLPPLNWQSAGTVTVTNVPQNLNVNQSTPQIFYRLQ